MPRFSWRKLCPPGHAEGHAEIQLDADEDRGLDVFPSRDFVTIQIYDIKGTRMEINLYPEAVEFLAAWLVRWWATR